MSIEYRQLTNEQIASHDRWAEQNPYSRDREVDGSIYWKSRGQWFMIDLWGYFYDDTPPEPTDWLRPIDEDDKPIFWTQIGML